MGASNPPDAPGVRATGHVTAYEASYVALAEALDCELLTADERLANAPGPRCPIRVIK